MENNHSALTITNINHKNAVDIYNQGLSLLNQNQILNLDFTNLKKFDSSIFAIILEWRRQANKHQYIINLNMPDKLNSLAKVYGIHNIL